MSHRKGSDAPIWVYPKHDPAWVKEIIDEFSIHPVTAQVLASRRFDDLEEIHDFLYAKLPELHDPDLLLDMDKAVVRVLKALENKEKILIYGDNDVDGITGTTLLTEFFEYLGVPVFSYISNRIALNQSLIMDALSYASSKGCTLLITVDCGITAASETKDAADRKIDIIVTDHHEPILKSKAAPTPTAKSQVWASPSNSPMLSPINSSKKENSALEKSISNGILILSRSEQSLIWDLLLEKTASSFGMASVKSAKQNGSALQNSASSQTSASPKLPP
jgi:single-stranded-DNA-specific exonuclease